MAKISTSKNAGKKNDTVDDISKQAQRSKKSDYLISMGSAPMLGDSTHWFQMLPAVFFTAVVIMITRMASYQRPMSQFYWSTETTDLVDFFSYYKMIAILICAIFVLILFLYRVFTQSFYIKRSYSNIFILLYTILVLLSYFFSEYKLFALWGWNDRFEGTISLLGYMILLFYIINSVNSEKNIKWIIYPIAVTSSLLGLLGVTQALDYDFFRTTIGKKLITPSWFWDQLDSLNFTFQQKEIYQTVYNINYVSFYLTLLIPLFGMLFIKSVTKGKEEALWKKISWGALFTLLIFNLIGSASSGGILGMAVVVFVAIIVLNKKILIWWKPLAILIILTLVVAGGTYQRWMPELSSSINSANISTSQIAKNDTPSTNIKPVIDYIDTNNFDIDLSINGEKLTITTFPNDYSSIKVIDKEQNSISLVSTNEENTFRLEDERFNMCTVMPAKDTEGNHYFIFTIADSSWPFMITDEGVLLFNQLENLVDMDIIPSVGFENNWDFGSGRGFIWSKSIPMMKDTLLIGYGADTYCIYFPHKDYAGKYNWGGTSTLNLIIDKPHNMYIGAAVGTGLLSLLSLIAIWLIYIIQSIKIYWKSKFETFQEYVGIGIFLGICGFLASGIVDDSSVSVMPLFYGLLGTGIAINQMLSKNKTI